ncbi:MAG: S46 family peptidase [marine benthic group bacterium]|nr:S46 family peptidase [Gemmatimonadota bacterium]
MHLPRMKRWLMATATVALAGCASSGSTPPETQVDLPAANAKAPPPPGVVPETGSLLTPSAEAMALAEEVVLDGTEMGTMWTFENPPLDYWAETYGFRPSADWLEHARLSSVRYGGGCSASFVSADGLVMTNHHCARGCVDAVAGEGEDFLVNGFEARSRSQERVCPNLFLDQLIEIDDITDRIHGVAQAGMTNEEISEAQASLSEELTGQCEANSDFQCQVVNLFHGGQYKIYKFRRFQPVKLVFAPELQAGFFGGDPDNFVYPRYNLDVTFVRAYEADGTTPASTPHFFEWDPDGAAEGELVFVTGNPGSTARQITLSQYMYEREIWHPMILDFFDQRLEILHEIQRTDPERGRAMQNMIFGYENTQKLYRGELAGLRSTDLTAKKIRWEQEFKAAVAADPALQAEYGDVWDNLAKIQQQKAMLAPTVYMNNPGFLGASQHLATAGLLQQYVTEMAKPDAERNPQFQGDAAAQVRGQLANASSFPMDQSMGMLAGRLMLASTWLPADAPLNQVVRPGESYEAAATRMINGSRIADPAFRTEIMDGGPDAIAAANDPLLDLVAEMRAAQATALPGWSSANAAEEVQNERFAKALFAVYGTDLPPDATFTLRITDGVVERYRYNETFAPAQTSIYGYYARATEFNNEMPWTMPQSWWDAKDRVNMSVPINFVSTNDITGGNSGSPVIDRDARLVGIAFDGNPESLPNEFFFAAENGRTVSVHSAGIIEALKNVYGMTELVNELLGGR